MRTLWTNIRPCRNRTKSSTLDRNISFFSLVLTVRYHNLFFPLIAATAATDTTDTTTTTTTITTTSTTTTATLLSPFSLYIFYTPFSIPPIFSFLLENHHLFFA